MGINTAVVGLGSNIDPEENIEKAREAIASEFKVIKSSLFVETEPIGYKEQRSFLNGALLIETDMDVHSLKSWLMALESDMGRVRSDNKDGPRTIDLDILVWNGEVVDGEVYERNFLKTSIGELLPDLDLD